MRTKGFRLVLAVAAGLLTAGVVSRSVEAQCPPPPGTYNLDFVPNVPFAACPGTTASFDIVGSSTGGAVNGFGFNVVISGGPVTGLTVTPGFPVPGPGGAFFASNTAVATGEVAAA